MDLVTEFSNHDHETSLSIARLLACYPRVVYGPMIHSSCLSFHLIVPSKLSTSEESTGKPNKASHLHHQHAEKHKLLFCTPPVPNNQYQRLPFVSSLFAVVRACSDNSNLYLQRLAMPEEKE